MRSKETLIHDYLTWQEFGKSKKEDLYQKYTIYMNSSHEKYVANLRSNKFLKDIYSPKEYKYIRMSEIFYSPKFIEVYNKLIDKSFTHKKFTPTPEIYNR